MNCFLFNGVMLMEQMRRFTLEWSFFTVYRPKSSDAKGLFDCLQSALQDFGIAALNAENYKMLVGIGTDGASVNIAAVGLKGLVEGELQWVFWMWYLAHRQELALN